MTRKEALAELIAMVEAGEIARSDLDEFIPVFGLTTDGNNALDAYRGSLDAAKLLHEAVLPGYGYGIFGTLSDGYCSACVVPKIDNPPVYHGRSDDLARAWLLAILRALHSMEPDA